jgi:hypothetical protein
MWNACLVLPRYSQPRTLGSPVSSYIGKGTAHWPHSPNSQSEAFEDVQWHMNPMESDLLRPLAFLAEAMSHALTGYDLG